jgi:hypothetical protein
VLAQGGGGRGQSVDQADNDPAFLVLLRRSPNIQPDLGPAHWTPDRVVISLENILGSLNK